ncbi:hypothetical protein [Sphingosinicella humi]|uniref:OmpA-like domain-containing protein n=1 Tax=Allosphingosinicella humi TaxID=2068657 RepID=A0A2U2J578_9SPHN|nr:hypothetical protein [Sphingosinicella humi]PWG03496.1 hypothetical protein DF286_11905 [Sphingosinicella humi]
MLYLYCTLFAAFLGAFLGGLTLWLVNRSLVSGSSGEPVDGIILGWSKDCEEALGECRRPSRMRGMAPERIWSFLSKHKFERSDRPSFDLLKSWPKQAELLHLGRYSTLARYKRFIAKGYDEPPGAEDYQGERRLTGKDRVSIALLVVLLIALIPAYFLMRTNDCFACEDQAFDPSVVFVKLTPTGPGKFFIEFNADQIFEYNEAGLEAVHRRRAEAVMRKAFGEFDGVSIDRVEGFTDPIGGLCDNYQLANGRADTVAGVLDGLQADGIMLSRPGQFAATGVGIGPGTEQIDVDQWKSCLATYQKVTTTNRIIGQGARRRRVDIQVPTPLILDRGEICTGKTPGQLTAYPERLIARDPRSVRDRDAALALSIQQRKLFSCLAPMRRVSITFSGTPRKKGELGPSPDLPAMAD